VFRRLLITYMTITALALAAVVVPLGLTFADRERSRLESDIEHDAQAVASLVEDALEAGTEPAIDGVLVDYADTGGRVVVVDTSGVSVADSDHIDGPRRDFSTRPEIAGALAGHRRAGTRPSETLGTDLMYVAIPVASGGVVHGAVRVTYPTSALDARVASMWGRLAALSLVVLAVVALVGMVLARSVTRPVRRLELAADRLAVGDLSARVAAIEGPPEIRALADTFNLTATRLSQLVESQRRFVADASHQLRTPLTALRLRLETLEPDVEPASRPKLEAALAEADRLARLVEGLLTLARSDSASLEVGIVDLATVAAERVGSWETVAHDRGVDVVVEGAGPTAVWAPAGALDQVLDNLLANALDAAPPGTAVTVRIAGDGPWVVLHVVDEGPGMSPEMREHAFERFWRPPGATGQGFGLGLAIVEQLTQACGGEVRLGPGPGGRGLDVAVRLVPGPAVPATTGLPQGPNPTLTSA
jgi:signal transduction histidine kinase